MSTVGPGPLQKWAHRLGRAGIALVDAPGSDGSQRAAEGRWLLIAALPRESICHALPVLKAKLVNQLLCGVHIAVAGQALAFAEAIGLDPRLRWDVVRQGAAASFMLDDRGTRMVDGAFDDVRSAMDIFVKGMGLVTRGRRAGQGAGAYRGHDRAALSARPEG